MLSLLILKKTNKNDFSSLIKLSLLEINLVD
jgi:hypothetical protein